MYEDQMLNYHDDGKTAEVKKTQQITLQSIISQSLKLWPSVILNQIDLAISSLQAGK